MRKLMSLGMYFSIRNTYATERGTRYLMLYFFFFFVTISILLGISLHSSFSTSFFSFLLVPAIKQVLVWHPGNEGEKEKVREKERKKHKPRSPLFSSKTNWVPSLDTKTAPVSPQASLTLAVEAAKYQ